MTTPTPPRPARKRKASPGTAPIPRRRRAAAVAVPAEVSPAPSDDWPLTRMAKDVRAVADQVISLGSSAVKAVKVAQAIGAAAADAAAAGAGESSAVGKAIGRARAIGRAADAVLALAPTGTPEALWGKTGKLLRDLRKAAGLTLAEAGQAVNLKDPALLEVVEKGKAALPFEIILRLAAVLGRNDPVSAVMTLTRTANPQVWEALEAMGFGKLMLQSAREREWVNVLRSEDSARQLSDEEFALLLAFVKSSFDLAIDFKRRQKRQAKA